MLAYKLFNKLHRIRRGVESDKKIKCAVGPRKIAEVAQLAQFGENIFTNGGDALQLFLTIILPCAQSADGSVLRNYRRADQDCILDFIDRRDEMLRHDHVTDAPTCEAVGFGERIERDGVLPCRINRPRRKMRRGMIGEV